MKKIAIITAVALVGALLGVAFAGWRDANTPAAPAPTP